MKRLLAGAALAILGLRGAAGRIRRGRRGSATIAGDGTLNFLAELEPGTRLSLGSDAAVAATFAGTGTEIHARRSR
jgi:hypothetical protein